MEAKKSKKSTPNKQLKSENNEADTGKIQAMPSNITKLITDTDLEEWPSFSNVSQVALRCHNVGVGIDQVEEFLIVQFRSQSEQQNTSKEKKKKKEDNFYSKHLCNKLIKSKEDESIRIENFLKYLEQNILSPADQVKVPLRRLEYTIAMWRLALVIQTCHINKKTQSLRSIRDFLDKNTSTEDCLNMIFNLGHIVNQKSSKNIKEKDFHNIVEFICKLEVQMPKNKVSRMPNLLLFTELDTVLESCLEDERLEAADRLRLHMKLSLVSWEASNFSRGLAELEAVTKEYLGQLLGLTAASPADQEARLLSLGLVFTELWTRVASTAAAQDMAPAVDYLLTLAEMTAASSDSSLAQLPAYLVTLAARSGTSEASRRMAERLEGRLSQQVRDEKFERCFHVAGMSRRNRQRITQGYIRRLLSLRTSPVTNSSTSGVAQEAPVKETETPTTLTELENQRKVLISKYQYRPSSPSTTDPDKHETVEDTLSNKTPEESSPAISVPEPEMTPKLRTDLLELRVMELIQEQRLAEMVATVLAEHAVSGLLPGAETLRQTCQRCPTIGSTIIREGAY